MAALAGGVLVDADHPRCGHFRLRQRVDQTQDGAPAYGHAEDCSQPGAGPAGQGEADCGKGRTQLLGALAIPAGQAGDLFHEGPARAQGVPAPEPPNPELEYDTSSGARYVGGKAQVGAVNPSRPGSASRASGAVRGALRIDTHLLDIHVHRQHRNVRDRREQQLLQPERNLFHGRDFQPNRPYHGSISGDFGSRVGTLSHHS